MLRVHRLAELVPAMATDEYAALVADVAKRGILTPIDISPERVVLDGRHRLQAASELGLAGVPVRVVCPPDEVEYMLLGALNRRHLSASQKAAMVVELDRYREQRQQAALRQRAGLRNGAVVATLPTRAGRSRDQAGELAGCSGRTVQSAQFVYEHDRQLFEQVKSGRLAANRACARIKRTLRDSELASKTLPLPAGPFELIYADPPWQLGWADSPYAPEQHYMTMPLDEIKALAVAAADNAVLYLWAVNSHVPEALEVMDAWGFQPKTCEVWIKPSPGLGNWTRNQHELLLVGARGTISPPDPQDRLPSVFEAPRGRHSEKPTLVYQRLEQLYPHLSKLELFARGTPREGWVAWGNEVKAA